MLLISYRRGLPTSGDIDMLITHPTFTSETSQTESKTGGPGGNLLKTVVEVLETEGMKWNGGNLNFHFSANTFTHFSDEA